MDRRKAWGCLLVLLALTFCAPCVPPGKRAATPQVSAAQNLASEGMKPFQVPARDHGFVRVGPTRRYFQFEDGTPFIPIGHNEWGRRFMEKKYSVQSMEPYFRNMRENGENVLRILTGSKDLPIETRVGVFNPAFQAYMDRLVGLAEKHHITLQIAMWPNVLNVPRFMGMGLSWSENVYNKKNGGPAATYDDLFRNPEAMRYQEGRIRYFVDHWGASPSIFAWEIANEFNYDNDAWVNHMSAYCAQYEMSRHGKRHLVGISVSSPTFGTPASAQWTSPTLDFTSYHTYDLKMLRSVKGRGIPRIVNYTFEAPKILREVWAKSPVRPILDTEIPAVTHGSKNALNKLPSSLPVQEEWFLGLGWAYLCAGASSPGFRWASAPLFDLAGGDNALSVKMYQYQLATRRITDRMDWNRFDPAPYTAMTVKTADGRDLRVQAIVSQDGQRMVAWVFESYGATAPVEATASLQALSAGAHRIAWYDDRTGAELGAVTASGPSVSARSPSFLGHTVLMVSPGR